MWTQQKAVFAGSSLELYTYEKPIEYGYIARKRSNVSPPIKEKNDEKTAENRKTSTYRTKRQIKRLIYANANQWFHESGEAFMPIFGTFTFADNVKSLTEANSKFERFIKRLNYRVTGSKKAVLKYINVVEFQKRGAVHYHTIFFNLPKLQDIYELFDDTWGNGFTFNKSIKDINHLGNYVTKYLTKSDRDQRLDERKAYFCSRGLHKPNLIRDSWVVDAVRTLLQCDNSLEKESVACKDFVDSFGGKVRYERFIVEPGKNFLKHLSTPKDLPASIAFARVWVTQTKLHKCETNFLPVQVSLQY